MHPLLNFSGESRITSPYGNVNVNVGSSYMDKDAMDKQIRSGALTFLKVTDGWNNAASSMVMTLLSLRKVDRNFHGHLQARVNGVGAVYGACGRQRYCCSNTSRW